MNKKQIKILVILFLTIFINFIIGNKTYAASPTKTVTHTILQSKWTNSKEQGPSYYDYDDGEYFGRLYKTSTTWETSVRTSDIGYYFARLTNNASSIPTNPPSISSSYWDTGTSGYDNVHNKRSEWDRGIEESKYYPNGGFLSAIIEHIGKPSDGRTVYRYRRVYIGCFDHNIYRFTSKYSGVVQARNSSPEFNITLPINNHRIGNQDNLFVSGSVKDMDIGDIVKVKYNLANIKNREITLTQPKNIISNGQNQSFQGYISLNGLTTGNEVLELYAEDNKGGISGKVNVPINIFNSLESILKGLKSYTFKSGQPTFMVVNTDTIIVQDTSNDNLINQIKQELRTKNVKLYFVGKDGPTRSYLESKLLK